MSELLLPGGRKYVLHEGSCDIVVQYDALFVDEPLPAGFDAALSGHRFAELWIEALQKKWPKTRFRAVVEPGMNPASVVPNFYHVDGKGLVLDAARIGHRLFGNRHLWLVAIPTKPHA